VGVAQHLVVDEAGCELRVGGHLSDGGLGGAHAGQVVDLFVVDGGWGVVFFTCCGQVMALCIVIGQVDQRAGHHHQRMQGGFARGRRLDLVEVPEGMGHQRPRAQDLGPHQEGLQAGGTVGHAFGQHQAFQRHRLMWLAQQHGQVTRGGAAGQALQVGQQGQHQLGFVGRTLLGVHGIQAHAGVVRAAGFVGLVGQLRHRLRQLWPEAEAGVQRQVLGHADLDVEGVAHEGRVGAGLTVDDLVAVAHADEGASLVELQQLAQHREHGAVAVVHLVDQQQLQAHVQARRQAFSQGRVVGVQQPAGQVVGGVVGAAEGGVVGVAAAALVFIAAKGAQADVVAAQLVGHIGGDAALAQLGLQRQAAFETGKAGQQALDVALVGIGQGEGLAVAVVGVVQGALQGAQHMGLERLRGAQLAHAAAFHRSQALGAELGEGLHAQGAACGGVQAQAGHGGAKGLHGGIGVGQHLDALRGHALGQRLAQAQHQRGGLGRARIGLHDDARVACELDGALLRRGVDAAGLEGRHGLQSSRSSSLS